MNADLLVYSFAILIDASMASVPLAANQEYFKSPGVISAINFASTPRNGSINSCDGMGLRRTCATTASTTSGWHQPRSIMPKPPSQSIYLRPITSVKVEPLPDHSTDAQSPASVTDLRYSSQPRLKCSAKLCFDSSMIHFACDSSGKVCCLITSSH